jgi:hypothetical protein
MLARRCRWYHGRVNARPTSVGKDSDGRGLVKWQALLVAVVAGVAAVTTALINRSGGTEGSSPAATTEVLSVSVTSMTLSPAGTGLTVVASGTSTGLVPRQMVYLVGRPSTQKNGTWWVSEPVSPQLGGDWRATLLVGTAVSEIVVTAVIASERLGPCSVDPDAQCSAPGVIKPHPALVSDGPAAEVVDTAAPSRLLNNRASPEAQQSST